MELKLGGTILIAMRVQMMVWMIQFSAMPFEMHQEVSWGHTREWMGTLQDSKPREWITYSTM